jgi:DNA-directed RNA polymerase beta' subunit
MGFKIAKDALDPHNNFLSTIKSGSKGDYFNLAQITALCTQQNISGKRVVPILNNGKRTLHHYPLEIKNVELDYESRGFIASSFIKGLNPRQFFFHTISGREGCSDKHNVSLTGSCCLWLSKTISDKQCNLLLIYNYLVTLL